MEIRWAFNHRLTLTIQWKYAIMTLISPKLLSRSNNSKSLATSYKNCAFAWCNKDSTIISIIDVEISSDVKNKVLRIFAVIYIILLLFNRINLFYFEAINFIFISIVIWIIFLLHCFRLQNIGLKRWLYWFLNRLLY